MPAWFIFQMASNIDSLRDETMFTLKNAIKYLSQDEYLPLVLAQDPPEKLLKKLGSFLEEFSKRLGLFALPNNLCDVETPGIPEIAVIFSCVCFWLDVCKQKLNKVQLYIYDEEKFINGSVKELNIYVKRILAQLTNLFNSTIWLGWHTLETMS